MPDDVCNDFCPACGVDGPHQEDQIDKVVGKNPQNDVSIWVSRCLNCGSVHDANGTVLTP